MSVIGGIDRIYDIVADINDARAGENIQLNITTPLRTPYNIAVTTNTKLPALMMQTRDNASTKVRQIHRHRGVQTRSVLEYIAESALEDLIKHHLDTAIMYDFDTKALREKEVEFLRVLELARQDANQSLIKNVNAELIIHTAAFEIQGTRNIELCLRCCATQETHIIAEVVVRDYNLVITENPAYLVDWQMSTTSYPNTGGGISYSNVCLGVILDAFNSAPTHFGDITWIYL
jgi:hypothetical protein